MARSGDVELARVLRSYEDFREPRDGLGDNPFKLVCLLSEPASPDEISAAWGDADVSEEAVSVWLVSRESRLFADVDYGQWGLALLTPADSVARTAEFRAQRADDARDGDVVIGEFLGDLELLVLGAPENGSRKVLVALPLDGRSDWFVAASSMKEFLQRYRDAHGDKYWERRSAE